jgi:hypothetical protein
MVRLEPEDFEDAELLGRMAESAGMAPEEFRSAFALVVAGMTGARVAA